MRPTWYERPLLVIDTETTGPDPSTDRPVQLAALTIDTAGSVMDQYVTLCNPGVEIPAEATALHGIATADLGEAPEPPTVIAEALRLIHHADHEGRAVVMFNVPFDWTILTAEAERWGIRWRALVGGPSFVDPLLLDRKLDRFRPGSRKLADVAAVYGVECPGAGELHRALTDALVAARLARKMVTVHPKPLAQLSLRELHERQAIWFEERLANFAAYRRRRRQPLPDSREGWPRWRLR